jgi:predicted small lipoprotein YifL
MRTIRRLAALVGLFALTGCGDGGPKTYPVSGKVAFAGGDAQKLTGHHVEAVLENDPNVRASGAIGPDGTFALETLHAGKVLKGVREGTYRVRLVPAEEDDSGKTLRKPPVAGKQLKFETSGLSLQVPPNGDVTLEFSSR